MTRDIALLVNPSAGRGRGARAAVPVLETLRRAGHRVRTVVGRDAAEALDLARAAVAGGPDALVVVGGDGMVGLALRAVAGTDTPLGVVAVGTGNDFARVNGLPVRDPRAAAERVAEAVAAGRTRRLDLGRVEGRWFGTVLASGFDSRVNDRGNRMSLPLGRFRYDAAMLAELAALRPIPYRVTFDDGPERELEAVLIAVGNGSSYGGGMRICPDADMADGLFDVCVVGPCSRTTLVRVFPLVYSGSHPRHPVVAVHRPPGCGWPRRTSRRTRTVSGWAAAGGRGDGAGALRLLA